MNPGDKVICRLFNTPEKRYYGASWVAEVLEVDHNHFEGSKWQHPHPRPYLVTRPSGLAIWLAKHEVKRFHSM